MDIYRNIEADNYINYINRVSDYKKIEYISTDTDKSEVLLKVTFCDATLEGCPDKEVYLSLDYEWYIGQDMDGACLEVYLGAWSNPNKLDINDGNYTDIRYSIENELYDLKEVKELLNIQMDKEL